MRKFAIALIVIAMLRIAATWTVFSATSDEPMHLAAGLQVLTEHRYELQLQNPPPPRVLIALGPWLAGARFDSDWISSFHAIGKYKTMLVLARSATLIYFSIASMALWLWARREAGDTAALIALLLFTTEPNILGHAGLATLDIAGVAGVAVSLLAFSHWLERPDARRTLFLGVAYGFSILCKLLCIAYVPLVCAALFLLHLFSPPRGEKVPKADEGSRGRPGGLSPGLRPPSPAPAGEGRWWLLFVPLIAFPIVWLGYGFSLTRFFAGINDMLAVNREGFPSYLFGRISTRGWWWYFPAALALKSTIGFLVLLVPGVVLGRRQRGALGALAAAVAILAWSMTTHVNVGIRYLLPIFLPLSVVAAAGAVSIKRTAAIILLAAHVLASAAAHPDYLAYFNAFAGRDPSRYLVDSNLDWGQDVLRLRDLVREKHIDSLGVSLMGPADFARLGFPRIQHLDPWSGRARGWIAVSDHSYRMSRAEGGWRWLVGAPYTRVGKSIRLYDLR